MKTPSFYRGQACELLKNYWGKSVGATLLFGLCCCIPSFLILGVIGGDVTAMSSMSSLLYIMYIFILPFCLGYSIAFLCHVRNKEGNFLLNTWEQTVKSYWRLLGGFLLIYLLIFAVVIAFSMVAFIIGDLLSHSSSIAIYLLLILAVIIFLVILFKLVYNYRMLPYIIHDNPELKVTKAIQESSKMIKGYKRVLFVLDCSIMQWYLYGVLIMVILIACGAAFDLNVLTILGYSIYAIACIGLLFIYPYMNTATALFYEDLQQKDNLQHKEQTCSVIEPNLE